MKKFKKQNRSMLPQVFVNYKINQSFIDKGPCNRDLISDTIFG